MDYLEDIIIKVLLIAVWIMTICLFLFLTPLRNIVVYPFIAGVSVIAVIALGLLIGLTIEVFKS